MTEISLDNYADLRDISRQFAGAIQAQAAGHLETVRHLFRPAGVFGPYVAGSHKDAPRDAGFAFQQFKTYFSEVAGGKPVSLDTTLPETIEVNFGTPVLQPFVYRHEVETRSGARNVAVTSPLQWVLGYPSHSLTRFRELITAQKRSVDEIREFALYYAVLHFVVTRNPRIQSLFEALRLPIQSEKLVDFGNFPFLVLHAPAGSERPPDEVIAQVCKYSGKDEVEEVLDREQWANLNDPFAEQYKPVAESMQF